jgi:hypothetical protein
MALNSPLATFQTDDRPSVYDRPGNSEVARLREETDRNVEAMDSPADLLADALHRQVEGYAGEMPRDRAALKHFVVAQFRSAAGPTAVSAMLEAWVAYDESVHIAKAVRRMLVLIRSQARPALTCDAIAIAMGIHIGEGRSLDEIASAHKITKQALSKRAIRICTELGLSPSVLMRSTESRESYRVKQRQRHAAARDAGMGMGSIASLKQKLEAARQHVTGRALKQIPA